ncbi:MAG TPA: PilZ domain-containing protein [Bryobacteraceae bacterium]|nr:PilZ domain-containing protein [Bryobacteraceae bacterium]
MSRGERRFNNRIEKNEKVELHWTDATHQTFQMAGMLADLSPSGARLLLDRPVPLNTALRLTLASHEKSGTVRYCTKGIRGYTVGVLFDS